MLTSDTDVHLVYQAIPAYSSTSKLDVGDYEGRTGLSAPTIYPSTVGNEANEGSLKPRHHVYAIDYYSSVGQEHPSLSGVLYWSIHHGDGNDPASKQ